MKKFKFLLMAAATSLAACTSDSLIPEDTEQSSDTEELAIGFDTYTSSSTQTATRSEYPGKGPFTSEHLQGDMTGEGAPKGGFGIFAYTHYNKLAVATGSGEGANTPAFFMYNQQVTYNGSLTPASWVYTPIKYWPNMTQGTSAGSGYTAYTDRWTGNTAYTDNKTQYVSFFAYAHT